MTTMKACPLRTPEISFTARKLSLSLFTDARHLFRACQECYFHALSYLGLLLLKSCYLGLIGYLIS